MRQLGVYDPAGPSHPVSAAAPAHRRRLSDAEPKVAAPPAKGKLGALIALLSQPQGATLDAMTAATGWQARSVRGAISGALKKKLGLAIVSEKTEAGRIDRIVQGPVA